MFNISSKSIQYTATFTYFDDKLMSYNKEEENNNTNTTKHLLLPTHTHREIYISEGKVFDPYFLDAILANFN